MPKKKTKKSDSSLARLISTTTSEGGGPLYLGLFRSKLKAEDMASTEDFQNSMKGYTQWHGHASWRSEVWAPIYDRRTEQLFIDTRNALCLVPAFREEIIQIRNRLSLRTTFLDTIAAEICKAWKIPNGEQWIVWLIEHWDPAAAKYPPLSTPKPPDSFSPWTIELNYRRETTAGSEVCRSATINLNAGVSKGDAERAVAIVLEKLDSSNKTKGRPGLSDLEREALRSEFEKQGIPEPQKRTAMILKVQKALTRSDNRQFSTTLIGQELRKWLREKKQPVRRYVTELSS